LAGFYQQVGLQAEDAISNLVVWSIWSQDKSQSFADLLNRTSLRFYPPRQPLDDSYSVGVRQRFLTTNKRVEVNAVEYLASIGRVSDSELPAQFGIPWNRFPSVRVIPPEHRKVWDMLPFTFREILRPLSTNGEVLASCYNKLKHGPQLIIANPLEVAQSRGHPPSQISAPGGFLLTPTIRLLLYGSRTQETPEESAASTRVAPFLLDDTENARHWLLQSLVHTANFLFVAGTWIFNFAFPDKRRDIVVDDAYVNSLIFQQGAHSPGLTHFE
jgi:hypothetical protein